ncbi:large conductance mechanosensitive channel protein MscL [soil metagenome]
MLREFREFIARGNVFELAVGIIIGAAFTAIVNSMVEDLINPIIGLFTGGIDFNNLFVALSSDTYRSIAAAEAEGVAVFRYGAFIMSVINFLIIAWVVFMMVRGVNRMRALTATTEKTEDAPALPTQEELLLQIRDLLREGSGPVPPAEALPPPPA